MKAKAFFQQLATLHSATCFLNSLLREWNNYSVSSSRIGLHIYFPLDQDNAIHIPLKKHSSLGRHQYKGTFYVSKKEILSEITFGEMLELISKHLADHFKTNEKQLELFKNRVLSSLHNMQHALEFRSDAIRDLEGGHFWFKESEQGLIIGHNFHPTPKSRDEFNKQDMLRFSPELGGRFNLDWFVAAPTIVHQKWAASFHEHQWTEELALKDLAQTDELEKMMEEGMIPIPMHPWQLKALLKNPLVAEYTKNKQMVYVGRSESFWYPTSSLRSIYRDGSPYMLKYSMSVKLTNSIRHLLTSEVDRGLQLQDVLETQEGKKFLAENPNFKIITEPAYLCIKDKEGNPMSESIVVCRKNPFNGKEAQGKIVLATLAQDAPLGGENLIQRLVQNMDSTLSLKERCTKWFDAFLNNAAKPLILAQANYGFMLGAHQQNLLLDIQNGLPMTVYFRDCQGTGYSELGYFNFADKVPSITRENGNVLNEKMGKNLFSYYLIINSTFNVITALCASDWISEEELISNLREFLKTLRAQELKDPTYLDYLLHEDLLMHKGNFICSFKSINENTSEDPLSIYTPIKNPIAFHRTGALSKNSLFHTSERPF